MAKLNLIGPMISQLRDTHSMSNYNLAHTLGMDVNDLIKIQKGSLTITEQQKVQIASVLDVPIEYFQIVSLVESLGDIGHQGLNKMLSILNTELVSLGKTPIPQN